MPILALALFAAAASSDPALGETRRVAVVVGNNAGSGARPPLRYAETDASKFASVLLELGGIESSNLMLLQGQTPQQLNQALAVAREKVRTWHQDPGTRVILIFFFSGHSDGEVLELGKETLAFSAARRSLTESGADVRLAIIDSCRSGALLAFKGGTPAPAFQIRLTDDLLSTGEAVLTSSAADELALESKEIGGSFFTHHLVSGMRGAADISGDGVVTLAEAYQYAFSRTVSATAATVAGTQHPAYDYQLAGQGELVLSELWRPNSALELPSGFDRLLVSRVIRDQVLAELPPGAKLKLAVVPGEYAVLGWAQEKLYGARIVVASGETRMVKKEDLLFRENISAVSKGGDTLSAVEKTAPPPRNAITVDPLWILYNDTLSLTYERATERKLSFFVRLPEFYHAASSGTLHNNDTMTTELLQGSSTQFGISGGLRFFITGEAPRGLWLSPEVGLGYIALKWTRFDSSLNSQGSLSGGFVSVRFGGSGGYAFVFGPIALSLGVGIAYSAMIGEIVGAYVNLRQVHPFMRIGIGYAF
jgi:hypothetical protein